MGIMGPLRGPGSEGSKGSKGSEGAVAADAAGYKKGGAAPPLDTPAV